MAIKGNGLTNPVLQFVDATGVPYASGTVTFTQVGVGTLQNIYSDSALTVPLPNPLPLNAAGRSSTSSIGVDSPVYFQLLPYDLTLKDASGLTVYGPFTFSGSPIPPNADIAFGGNVTIAGTLAVTGVATFSAGILGGWTTVSITDTGTQNNYAPGLAGQTIVRCNNGSLLTITGIAGGTSGQRVRFISIGAGQVDFAYATSAAGLNSTAANRLFNFATSGVTSLAAGVGTCEYEYDATTQRWRLLQHEQGAAITRTFAAGNYTASGSMTWTVASATTDSYYLRGRELKFTESVTGTVAGVAGTELRVTLPAGFIAAERATNPATVTTNATQQTGIADAQASVAYIRFFVDASGGTNWTVGSVAGAVSYNETIMVQ